MLMQTLGRLEELMGINQGNQAIQHFFFFMLKLYLLTLQVFVLCVTVLYAKVPKQLIQSFNKCIEHSSVYFTN